MSRIDIERAEWSEILKLTKQLMGQLDEFIDLCLDEGDIKEALHWASFETQIKAHVPLIEELARLQELHKLVEEPESDHDS